MNTIAVGAALASAAGFALSTSLQHHAAGTTAARADGLVQFIRGLMTRPTWLLGQFLAAVSFALHAVALHYGPLALVQPIVVSGIVIAVPARSLMSRHLPSLHEVGSVTLATAGLAVFIVATRPSEGVAVSPTWESFLVTTVLVAGAGGLAWLSTRGDDRRQQAAWMGATAGVLFGVVACLIKLSTLLWTDQGLGELLTSWPMWLLLLCGAGGIVSNQRAYTLAALSASLPVLNIVNVVVALVLGLVVFQEVPAHDPAAFALQIGALLAVAVGLRALAREEEEHALSVAEPPAT